MRRVRFRRGSLNFSGSIAFFITLKKMLVNIIKKNINNTIKLRKQIINKKYQSQKKLNFLMHMEY
jgi:hypothetical protein